MKRLKFKTKKRWGAIKRFSNKIVKEKKKVQSFINIIKNISSNLLPVSSSFDTNINNLIFLS